MLEYKDILTLADHTDRILWTGYSSDENMIGTVSDQTICIWNSARVCPERTCWLYAYLKVVTRWPSVAIGTFNIFEPGVVFLYDVGNTKITQKQVLSTNLCAVEPEMAKNMATFLECSAVEFVDEGRKLVVLTSGDGGIETYDLQKWEKWRFVQADCDP
jgi:hypothetical protein